MYNVIIQNCVNWVTHKGYDFRGRLYPSRKTSSSVFVLHTLLLLGYFKPLSMEFLVTNSKEISCYQFCRKTGENVDKISGNSWEFPAKSSSEPIPGNYSQDFLKSSSRIS